MVRSLIHGVKEKKIKLPEFSLKVGNDIEVNTAPLATLKLCKVKKPNTYDIRTTSHLTAQTSYS